MNSNTEFKAMTLSAEVHSLTNRDSDDLVHVLLIEGSQMQEIAFYVPRDMMSKFLPGAKVIVSIELVEDLS